MTRAADTGRPDPRRRAASGGPAAVLAAGLLFLVAMAAPAMAGHPAGRRGDLTATWTAPRAAAVDADEDGAASVVGRTAALAGLVALTLSRRRRARRPRRLAALAGAALLVWLAGETAIHAAHHAGHAADAERCPVFSAVQHLAALDVAAPAPALGASVAVRAPGIPSPLAIPSVAPARARSRAPPAPFA
jgi:hypothetical protein